MSSNEPSVVIAYKASGASFAEYHLVMPWVPVVAADAVPAGGIVAIDLDDRQLVIWRTTGGELVACDARCPHQWSHLEAEGVVDGDELVCTAHFWRFDVAGHGTKLNVLGRRDEKSDVEVFPIRPRDGQLEIQVAGAGDEASSGTGPAGESM
jgi:nitrite reductase/ring-hydroxylating ferredoxin subunit